jgi:GTPase
VRERVRQRVGQQVHCSDGVQLRNRNQKKMVVIRAARHLQRWHTLSKTLPWASHCRSVTTIVTDLGHDSKGTGSILYNFSRGFSSPFSTFKITTDRDDDNDIDDDHAINKNHKNKGIRRRLDVAIVGAPNAGKSQLLNVMTGSTVAAVSRKRHTTRLGIMAVRTVDNTQLVFKDTPGFLKLENAKEERLDPDLIATAASEVRDVDFTLLVVDAARALTDNYRQALVSLMLYAVHSQGRVEEEDYDLNDDDKEDEEGASSKVKKDTQRDGLEQHHKPKFAIVLNKVDLVKPKSKLLDMALDIGSMADECLRVQYRHQPIIANKDGIEELEQELDDITLQMIAPMFFYVSAKDQDGTEDLVHHLLDLATPSRVWPLSATESTDMSPQERVQEIIREKLYRCLHREVPHSIQQINRVFRRVEGGMVIHQDLIVFTKSHQKLVRGNAGRTLERIHESAVRDLKELFQCDVTLRLHVKLNRSNQLQQHSTATNVAQEELGVTTQTFD